MMKNCSKKDNNSVRSNENFYSRLKKRFYKHVFWYLNKDEHQFHLCTQSVNTHYIWCGSLSGLKLYNWTICIANQNRNSIKF